MATEQMLLERTGSDMKEYAVLPSIPFAIWRDLMCRLNFFVREETPSRTMVQLNTAMQAYESNMTERSHTVFSNGTIEAQILTDLSTRLQERN